MSKGKISVEKLEGKGQRNFSTTTSKGVQTVSNQKEVPRLTREVGEKGGVSRRGEEEAQGRYVRRKVKEYEWYEGEHVPREKRGVKRVLREV